MYYLKRNFKDFPCSKQPSRHDSVFVMKKGFFMDRKIIECNLYDDYNSNLEDAQKYLDMLHGVVVHNDKDSE